jgi:phosphoserine phosphatase RsbU/P
VANSNPIKRLFDLYTSDLSYQEIERLIKREAGEVYEFFAREIPKPDKSRSRFARGLIFARSLFNAFLLKLTPARRIFYLAALLFFIVGYGNSKPGYIFLSFIILNLLLAFELADKLSARGELDVARKIQSDLIPKHSSGIFDFSISSFYEPAREVGGDYFDVIESPQKTFIFVGDISGKGMAAALYMVRVQSILHLLLESLTDVREITVNLKKYFSKNLRREYFLTLVSASIERDGTVSIVRAGHLPVYWYKSSEKKFEIVCPAGIAIGFNDKGIFERTLEVAEFRPEANDLIFIQTDGVTETMNTFFSEFGEENVKRILSSNANKSADEIKQCLLKAIANFRGQAVQHDDVTFVIIKKELENRS